TAVGASHSGFCVDAATRRPEVRELSAAAAFFTEVERVESFAFSATSPPRGAASFAELLDFAASLPAFLLFGASLAASFAELATGSFAVLVTSAVSFAVDALREDDFFLLLAMK